MMGAMFSVAQHKQGIITYDSVASVGFRQLLQRCLFCQILTAACLRYFELE